MWESPESLWGRLKLGREEFLQRSITTLVLGGEAPPWNSPRVPSPEGMEFLRLLDATAHGDGSERQPDPDSFVDEYLLPKVQDAAENGWPDWAVLWPDRLWVIELKTEKGSHRPTQLPYYLRLATAAHPDRALDLTYITGPLAKPAPELGPRQRYSHLVWTEVLPLVQSVWASDPRPEVRRYVDVVTTVITNLVRLRPVEQRVELIGPLAAMPTAAEPERPLERARSSSETPGVEAWASAADSDESTPEPSAAELLRLARATGADGRQRGVGVASPELLILLREKARDAIGGLSTNDVTRYVMPWVWDGATTGGQALTAEGAEFGYELRFSRYAKLQSKS